MSRSCRSGTATPRVRRVVVAVVLLALAAGPRAGAQQPEAPHPSPAALERSALEAVWGDRVGHSADDHGVGSFVVADEVIVAVADPQIARVAGELGAVHTASIEPLGVHLLRFPGAPDRAARAERLADVRAHPSVNWAEENGLGGSGGFVPDDPAIGDDPSSQWHLAALGAFDAWDVTRGDPSIGLAILDSGWESANAEFSGDRFVPGRDVIDNDDDPEADHPHGVRILGLAAGNTDNGFSGAGIAHETTAHVFKSLNSENRSSNFQFASAVVAAADLDPPPAVMSLSLINYGDTEANRAAIGYARDRGVVVIACAGNGGIGDADVTYPGRDDRVISIGATTITGARASFSGTGAALDFVAPGAGIVAVRPDYLGGGLDTVNGCSYATPLAAGIAALMLAVDPSLTQQDIHDVWIATASDEVAADDLPGRDDNYGHGSLDANAAVRYVRDWPTGRFGDTNCDGRADIVDALLISQLTVGNRTDAGTCPLPEPASMLRAGVADLNDDGVTDIVDALLLSQCTVGIDRPACPTLGDRLPVPPPPE